MNGTIQADSVTSHEYGRRLLPVELDRVATVDPGRSYFSRLRDPTNPAHGFEEISYRRVANAVNRTAHWLRAVLGKPKDIDTIAYLAAPDMRNVLLALAVSKAGFKVCVSCLKGIDQVSPDVSIAAASIPPQQRSGQY